MRKGSHPKLRHWTKFLPGIVWAIILDIISILLILLGVGILLVLNFLSLIGAPIFASIDQIFTVFYGFVQILATYLIFDEPKMLIMSGAKTVPLLGTLLNIVPSYTVLYILIDWGYV